MSLSRPHAAPSAAVSPGGEQADIGSVRRDAARRIGGRTAALDARLLVAHALGADAERIAMDDARAVSPRERAAIDSLVARRAAGEPVARIVGEKEFWGLPFRVTPAVLTPRPDTETLVEAVLKSGAHGEVRMLDIGTGSGAILLSLLSELPDATGVGTDISPDALRVAADNAGRLGVAGRCRFVATNWADGVMGAYHFIVANPPYIDSGAIAELEPDVRDHDPRGALDGGPDGFEGHRAVLAATSRLLAPGGHGFVEIGYGQDAGFAALAARTGFRTRLHFDLAGIARVAEISR